MKVRILFEEYRQKEMNIDDLSQQAMHMYDNGEIILTPDDTQSVHLHVKNDFER